MTVPSKKSSPVRDHLVALTLFLKYISNLGAENRLCLQNLKADRLRTFDSTDETTHDLYLVQLSLGSSWLLSGTLLLPGYPSLPVSHWMLLIEKQKQKQMISGDQQAKFCKTRVPEKLCHLPKFTPVVLVYPENVVKR